MPFLHATSAKHQEATTDWFRRVVDFGLLGCLVLTPLALGGRHDLGRFIYAASVAIATLATVGRTLSTGVSLRVPRLPLAIGLAALGVVSVQLIPLPEAWLATLAPGHSQLLPVWSSEALGTWRTVSLAPAETLEGLALLGAHTLLFFVVVNRIDSVSDIRRLLGWIAVAGVGMAGLAVLQSAFPSDRLLWFYDLPQRSFARGLMGSFANRNHLAHFLLLGVTALAAFALQSPQQSRPRKGKPNPSPAWRSWLIYSLIVGLLVVVMASQSRGAAVAAVAGGVALATLRWSALGVRLKEVLAIFGVGAAVLMGISLFDYDQVTGRLDDLVSGQISQLDQANSRRMIWAANARAIAANPVLGHGAGSHRYMYPAYIEGPAAREFTHAESSYLQIGSETGGLGLLVLAAALFAVLFCLVGGIRRSKSESSVAIWGALGAGLAVSCTHAVMDFVWYLPALVAVPICFAAAAWRLRELQGDKPETNARTSPRPAAGVPQFLASFGAATAAAFCMACLWGPAAGATAGDVYRRASKTAATLTVQRLAAAPAGRDPQLAASLADAEDRATASLEAQLRQDPGNARAHARLASRLQRRFERVVAEGDNPMTLDSIRDAATNGGFGNLQQRREWFARAFGEDAKLLQQAYHHAETAIRLCPLQGEAYLLCNALGFLHPPKIASGALIDQSVLLAPWKGQVCYEAGRQCHLSGDLDGAYHHYAKSLKLPGSHCGPLALALAASQPAQELLKQLKPDAVATDFLITAYRLLESTQDLVVLAEHAEGRARIDDPNATTRQKAYRWRQLSMVNRSIDRLDRAAECAAHAYEILPNDFWVRYELAAALTAAERHEEADRHVRWCFARRPDLRQIEIWLHEGAKERRRANLAARPTAADALTNPETNSRRVTR